MEENLEKQETRLRSENTNLADFYEKKLLALNLENDNLLKSHELKLTNLNENNEKNLTKTRSDYDDELRTIRNDHKISIEIIR